MIVNSRLMCVNQIYKVGQEPYSVVFFINICSVIRVCIYPGTATMFVVFM